MLKKLVLAVAALGVSTAALARDGGWERDRDRGRDHRMEQRFHEERRPVVVEHRPVFVEPPRHVAYAPPAPVYQQPGVSFSVNIPW